MQELVFVLLVVFEGVFGRVRIPPNPCPNVFSYYKSPGNGEIFGEAVVPYDGGNVLEFSVNASFVGLFNKKADLRIQLATPPNEIGNSPLKYSVFFPFYNVIPRITQIQYNSRVYCSGPPEPLIPGGPGITNVWAGYIYKFGSLHTKNENDNAAPKNPPENRPDTFDVDLPEKDPNNPNLPSNFQALNPFLAPNHPQGTPHNHPPPPPPARPPPSETTTKENTTPLIISNNNKNIDEDNNVNNKNYECGVSQNVIVPLVLGGRDIADGLFPWLTAMFVSQGNSYEYKCTANLITDKHVVTAARCVQFYKVQIVKTEDMLFVLGKTDVSRWATNGAVTRTAVKVQTHPEYDDKTAHADITIITLNRPVQFSDTIAPICLWQDDADLNQVINKKGTVAGWGMDEFGRKNNKLSVAKAKYVDMPVVSQEDCLYSNFTYGSLTTDSTFCAGGRDGIGPCIGDSGAGFMMERNGKLYLRGLVSLALTNSENNCDLNNFVIFCDAAKCKGWIDTTIKAG